jgi:hypothetical protein
MPTVLAAGDDSTVSLCPNLTTLDGILLPFVADHCSRRDEDPGLSDVRKQLPAIDSSESAAATRRGIVALAIYPLYLNEVVYEMKKSVEPKPILALHSHFSHSSIHSPDLTQLDCEKKGFVMARDG